MGWKPFVVSLEGQSTNSCNKHKFNRWFRLPDLGEHSYCCEPDLEIFASNYRSFCSRLGFCTGSLR